MIQGIADTFIGVTGPLTVMRPGAALPVPCGWSLCPACAMHSWWARLFRPCFAAEQLTGGDARGWAGSSALFQKAHSRPPIVALQRPVW